MLSLITRDLLILITYNTLKRLDKIHAWLSLKATVMIVPLFKLEYLNKQAKNW